MAWEHYLFETRTGIKTHRVYPEKHSWTTRLNGYGTGSTTVVMSDEEDAQPPGGWDLVTTPWRTGIVSLWDGVPWYAGIIHNRQESMPDGRLVLEHAEVWKLLGRRYLWGVDDYEGDATRVMLNLSRRGMVGLLLEWTAVSGSPSPRWSLPVVVGGLQAGGLSRTLRAWRFDKGMKLIEDILAEAGGPDLYLKPRMTNGRVEWEAVIGSPRVPGPTVAWQWGPQESPLRGLTLTEDASDQLTGGFTIGEGSEVDMLVGKGDTLATFDLPVMDLAESAKNVEEQWRLDAMAQGFVDQRSPLQAQWDFGVQLEALERGARPGTRVRLRVEGSRLRPSRAWQDLYLVSASGDLSEFVRVGVQAV